MLKSGNFLKYFRVHSTQIDIFKKRLDLYQFGTSTYDCINMQISKALYTRLKVSKINIGSIHDNYIFLPNLRNIRH